MEEERVVVVGAGQAGIATALALADRGVKSIVLEEADKVAASWRGRYDRLRLNTSRQTSRLGGRPYAKGTPKFPTREQVIENIERHATEAGLAVELGTRVERIERRNGGWRLQTSAGDLQGSQVVLATGYARHPHIPDWAGRAEFAGTLIHSAEYRNAEPFANKDVLVVGPGCSGMEIAHDVAEGGAARVRLAVRRAPNIALREGPGGIPGDWIGIAMLHLPTRFGDWFSRVGQKADCGDLTECGLPFADEGLVTLYRRDDTVPTIVDKEVIDAIKERRIEIVSGVESLDRNGATLDDGTRLELDAIIAATGYKLGLEPLVGALGVLDDRGRPATPAPAAAAPGLRFVGYTTRPGALGWMSKQAKQAAKAIARELSH